MGGMPTPPKGHSTPQLPEHYDHRTVPTGLKRYQCSGHDHLVTFSCYRRRPYLDNDHARTVFLSILEELRQRHRFHVFGYVLMPEHLHMLLGEPKVRDLASTLNVLKTQTSRQLKGDRKQFWQIRYHDWNVITHPKFVEKLRYIHRNPVKRGLVDKPQDWLWSSYRHWLTGEPGPVEVESHWTWDQREKSDGNRLVTHPSR